MNVNTGGGDLDVGINVFIINNFTSTANQVRQSARGLQSDLEFAADRINQSFYRITAGIGTVATGVALIAGITAVPLKLANDLEYQLTKISTLQDYTIADMKEFRNAALEAANDGLNPIDAAKTLYDEVQAGIEKATDATKFLTEASKLAIASDGELGVVVDGLTSVINAYGMKISEVTKLNDQFFLSTLYGKHSVEDLARRMGHVAPIAAAMGVSTKQVLSAIASVTAGGVPGSEAITGLSMLIKNLTKPTEQATKALAELSKMGIHVPMGVAQFKTAGFVKTLEVLKTVQEKAPDKFMQLIGSIEGYRTALHLVTNGQTVFNRTLQEMDSRSGVTQQAYEKMMNTVNKQLERTKALSISIGIAIGDALNPVFAPLLRHFNDMLKVILDFVRTHPIIVRGIVLIGIALGGLLIIAGSVLTAFAMWQLASAAVEFAGVAMGGTLLAVLSRVALAFWPVFAAAYALGMVAYAVYKAWENNVGGIRDLFSGWYDTLRLVWLGITALISTTNGDIGNMPGELADALDKAGLLQFVIKLYMAWTRLKHFVYGIWTGFLDVWSIVYPIIAFGIKTITDILRNLGYAAAIVTDMFAGIINEDGVDWWEAFGRILVWFATAVILDLIWAWALLAGGILFALWVVSKITWAFGKLRDICYDIGYAAADLWMRMRHGALEAQFAAEDLWDALKTYGEAWFNWAQNQWERFKRWVGDSVESALARATDAWNWFKSTVGGVLDWVHAQWSKLMFYVTNSAQQAVNNMSNHWQTLKTKFITPIIEAYNAILSVNWAELGLGIVQRIANGIMNAGDAIKNAILSKLNLPKEGFSIPVPFSTNFGSATAPVFDVGGSTSAPSASPSPAPGAGSTPTFLTPRVPIPQTSQQPTRVPMVTPQAADKPLVIQLHMDGKKIHEEVVIQEQRQSTRKRG